MKYSGSDICKRFSQLYEYRCRWEYLWEQSSRYVMPSFGRFHESQHKIFDSTAPNALNKFVSILGSSLTPRTSRWHKLSTGNQEADSSPEVGRWLEAVSDILFNARYNSLANFDGQILEAYTSLGLFGTAVIYIDEDPSTGLRYQNIPLWEVHLSENSYGRVDTVYRKFKLTSRQAMQQYGEDNLPQCIIDDARDVDSLEKEYEFIHAVFPRSDYKRDTLDADEYPIASITVVCEGESIVNESGYKVMPYAVSRFYKSFREVYGRSPSFLGMPDIITANEIVKTLLRAGQKITDPPTLVGNDDILGAFDFEPGGLIYGAITGDGKPLVQPMQLTANIPVGMELLQASRQVINNAFFIDLFQVLMERAPNQTATEVMQRAQEQAQLLAPVISRQQDELLFPIIRRELSLLLDAGAIPEPPNGLEEVIPVYSTQMMDRLKSNDAQAIINAMQSIAPIIQLTQDTTLLGNINLDEAIREIWVGMGASAKVLKSEEEVTAMRQEAQQAQQAEAQNAQLMELAKSAGSIGTGMEKVSAMTGGNPLEGII